MASLPNYLRTYRRRASFTQEEAAFLLGANGIDRANKVLRDENSDRMPTLKTALAYELIYGRPARELFAGEYEQVAREVEARMKILRHRTAVAGDPAKEQALTELADRCSALTN